jgi:hypothetical protein
MDLHMKLITFLKELLDEATDDLLKASLDEKIETGMENLFNFLDAKNILPKKREYSSVENKLESVNAKKCDSDSFKGMVVPNLTYSR